MKSKINGTDHYTNILGTKSLTWKRLGKQKHTFKIRKMSRCLNDPS